MYNEQTVSGNIVFQPEQGAKDGGCYFVQHPVTHHGVGIPTRNITPSDLRAMADHLESYRQTHTG